MKVPPSQPPSSKSLDAGWGLFPELDQHDGEDDDTRTLQVSSPLFKGAPSFDDADESQNERDTMPPPVPVAQYVQTMMEQAIDEPEPSARPISSPTPFLWQNALPPSSSRHGAPSERSLPIPAPRRVDSWSVPATLSPPGDNVNDEDDDEVGGFTLVAHEPERLGGARGDVDDPRFRRGPSLSPGFDDLPFDDVIAASERAAAGPRFPTPVPVLPSSRQPGYGAPPVPPSSRREPPFPSMPPILGAAWASPEPREAERPTTSPPTKRGVSAEPPPPQRAHPGTQRYGSIGDASVLPKPPSTQRAPIMAPRPAPPPAPVDPFDDVRELFDAGDFRSALVMAEALLEAQPDHAQAKACLASCRETLTKKYLGRLGGLAKILRVAMPPDEIRWLSLDHKAGFLLSCIDGTSSIEEVLDVACMQQFEAIRILHDFRELGVIEILPDPRASRR